MLSTRPSIGESLAPPSASARGLDRHDVAGCEVARDLGADRLAVDGVVSGRARLAAALAARGAAPAFADDREAAILEDAELADDAVAAAVHAVAAGAQPQAVALDTQWVLQLERLDRRRQRVRHGDVHAAGPIRGRARALSAADRLVVREAVAAERDVVHRPLSLRRDVDRLAERAHDAVDDP